MEQNYDVRFHEVQFESLYNVEIMKDSFKKFLQSENKQDPFDYYFEIKNLKRQLEIKEQKAIVNNVIEKYFQDNKLNLNKKLSQKLKKKLVGFEKKTVIDHEISFLERISRIVNQELYEEYVNIMLTKFPLFLRSPIFEKTIKKVKISDNVFSFKKLNDFPFTDQDFINNEITDMDKNFLISLVKDDVASFDLVFSQRKSDTNINSYYSSQKYLPKVTPFKNQGVLKYKRKFNY
jgi:hypothetical protein